MILMFSSLPFAMGEEKQRKGNISQHQAGPVSEKEKYGKYWRKEKICFSNEQSLDSIRGVLRKIKLIYTSAVPREGSR